MSCPTWRPRLRCVVRIALRTTARRSLVSTPLGVPRLTCQDGGPQHASMRDSRTGTRGRRRRTCVPAVPDAGAGAGAGHAGALQRPRAHRGRERPHRGGGGGCRRPGARHRQHRRDAGACRARSPAHRPGRAGSGSRSHGQPPPRRRRGARCRPVARPLARRRGGRRGVPGCGPRSPGTSSSRTATGTKASCARNGCRCATTWIAWHR